MGRADRSVDEFFRQSTRWQAELARLRALLLASPLTEVSKWGVPVYTYNGKNVVIMGALKDCCTLGFVKGALLQDAHGLLVAPGENSQAMRVMRFRDPESVAAGEAALADYLDQAIALEAAGAKVDFRDRLELVLVTELQASLDADPVLKAAFLALTPGRQRAYNLHFSAPKQSATRQGRIDKCRERILAGKGMTDR